VPNRYVHGEQQPATYYTWIEKTDPPVLSVCCLMTFYSLSRSDLGS
jgi:hypothetical protein